MPLTDDNGLMTGGDGFTGLLDESEGHTIHINVDAEAALPDGGMIALPSGTIIRVPKAIAYVDRSQIAPPVADERPRPALADHPAFQAWRGLSKDARRSRLDVIWRAAIDAEQYESTRDLGVAWRAIHAAMTFIRPCEYE